MLSKLLVNQTMFRCEAPLFVSVPLLSDLDIICRLTVLCLEGINTTLVYPQHETLVLRIYCFRDLDMCSRPL